MRLNPSIVHNSRLTTRSTSDESQETPPLHLALAHMPLVTSSINSPTHRLNLSQTSSPLLSRKGEHLSSCITLLAFQNPSRAEDSSRYSSICVQSPVIVGFLSRVLFHIHIGMPINPGHRRGHQNRKPCYPQADDVFLQSSQVSADHAMMESSAANRGLEIVLVLFFPTLPCRGLVVESRSARTRVYLLRQFCRRRPMHQNNLQTPFHHRPSRTRIRLPKHLPSNQALRESSSNCYISTFVKISPKLANCKFAKSLALSKG
jgi:hypothetical protein